jgi:hypothetical protein
MGRLKKLKKGHKKKEKAPKPGAAAEPAYYLGFGKGLDPVLGNATPEGALSPLVFACTSWLRKPAEPAAADGAEPTPRFVEKGLFRIAGRQTTVESLQKRYDEGGSHVMLFPPQCVRCDRG